MREQSRRFVYALLLSAAGVFSPLHAAEPTDVQARKLMEQPLAGEPGKEAFGQLYTIAPGASLPWHIHPDADEIAYDLEGNFTVEIEGRGLKELKPGDVFYVPPNAVHRGLNRGNAEVKLFVLRIKPIGKPLVVEVPAPHTVSEGEAAGPAPQHP